MLLDAGDVARRRHRRSAPLSVLLVYLFLVSSSAWSPGRAFAAISLVYRFFSASPTHPTIAASSLPFPLLRLSSITPPTRFIITVGPSVFLSNSATQTSPTVHHLHPGSPAWRSSADVYPSSPDLETHGCRTNSTVSIPKGFCIVGHSCASDVSRVSSQVYIDVASVGSEECYAPTPIPLHPSIEDLTLPLSTQSTHGRDAVPLPCRLVFLTSFPYDRFVPNIALRAVIMSLQNSYMDARLWSEERILSKLVPLQYATFRNHEDWFVFVKVLMVIVFVEVPFSPNRRALFYLSRDKGLHLLRHTIVTPPFEVSATNGLHVQSSIDDPSIKTKKVLQFITYLWYLFPLNNGSLGLLSQVPPSCPYYAMQCQIQLWNRR